MTKQQSVIKLPVWFNKIVKQCWPEFFLDKPNVWLITSSHNPFIISGGLQPFCRLYSTSCATSAALDSTDNGDMPTKQQSTAGSLVTNVHVVEDIVSEIKENLRYRNVALKAKSSLKTPVRRSTPYHIPCRSWSEDAAAIKSKKQREEEEDPYELLQALIDNNTLVKEAVRRLQQGLSAKQRYFYESDEECMSPVLRMCRLELWIGRQCRLNYYRNVFLLLLFIRCNGNAMSDNGCV